MTVMNCPQPLFDFPSSFIAITPREDTGEEPSWVSKLPVHPLSQQHVFASTLQPLPFSKPYTYSTCAVKQKWIVSI